MAASRRATRGLSIQLSDEAIETARTDLKVGGGATGILVGRLMGDPPEQAIIEAAVPLRAITERPTWTPTTAEEAREYVRRWFLGRELVGYYTVGPDPPRWSGHHGMVGKLFGADAPFVLALGPAVGERALFRNPFASPEPSMPALLPHRVPGELETQPATLPSTAAGTGAGTYGDSSESAIDWRRGTDGADDHTAADPSRSSDADRWATAGRGLAALLTAGLGVFLLVLRGEWLVGMSFLAAGLAMLAAAAAGWHRPTWGRSPVADVVAIASVLLILLALLLRGALGPASGTFPSPTTGPPTVDASGATIGSPVAPAPDTLGGAPDGG